ncbi:MAG: two-component system, chemotaxis family, sensor kinase CheA [Paraburkholderia sp.]|nr:two-component system, chemotaxis family, sensor kinase CheA [Paraburkholderia sp.]
MYQTRGSAAEVRKVTEGVVPGGFASADLVSQVKDVQLATMTLVYAPDANRVAQAQDELKKKKDLLQQGLALQAKDAASHAQEGLVSQAKDSLENYFSAITETAKMKADGKNELAQAYLFANVAQYRDELEGIVETLRVEKNRQKDEAISTLNATLATTTTAIAIVTGIAIILLTSFGSLLYRQITRPFSRMQAMMSEIASSQDFTRRVPVKALSEEPVEQDEAIREREQAAQDMEALAAQLREELIQQSTSLDELRATLKAATDDKDQWGYQAHQIAGEAARLKGLGATFERWHEQMISLMTQNHDMHAKNQELSSIVRHVVIVSLNASIEAARAGSAGRGFAVVASGVRALAARSEELSKSYRDSLHRNDLTTTSTFQDIQAGGKMIAASLATVESLANQFQAKLHQVPA